MNEPVLKAFVICDEIIASAKGSGRKDLRGAGLISIRGAGSFPYKQSFWVYAEMTDQRPFGEFQIALMRADSGRRVFFRSVRVRFPNPLQTTIITVRVFDCIFPATGIYFVEVWYDGQWISDQRIEVF